MSGLIHDRKFDETGQWSPAFLVDDLKPGNNLHLVGILAASLHDIYSAKLKVTRAVCQAIADGGVVSLLPGARGFTFLDAVHLLSVIGTHNRLARGSFARLRAPARWVEADDLFGRRTYRPCFPVSQICEVTGLDHAFVTHVAHFLARDGALRIHGSGKSAMLQMVDGYMDNQDIGRHLEI